MFAKFLRTQGASSKGDLGTWEPRLVLSQWETSESFNLC